MKVLVINSGSSSMKYQLIDMEDEKVLAKGNYERIGSDNSFVTHKVNGEKYKTEKAVVNHKEALDVVLKEFTNSEYGVISDLSEITAVGHRIVHGGTMTESMLVTDEVIENLKELIPLDPLHNPAAISVIEACKELMPTTPMVTVYDTSFHQTIPESRYLYPIPYKFYEKYGIRKYGFHGTSHRYVSKRAAELMGRDPEKGLKLVTCHIGQGASLCAVENGKAVDTTMGFTSLGGIAMGTRSGDLDPSVVTYIMEKEKLTPEQMDTMLNKESGLLGITELSGDNRDLWASIEDDDNHADRAKLALETYTYIIAQYIAKMVVAMNGVDGIIFTGGVGERGCEEREMICEKLKWMGVELDLEANKVKAEEQKLSTADSKVEVWTIPTEEELMIARDTKQIVENLK